MQKPTEVRAEFIPSPNFKEEFLEFLEEFLPGIEELQVEKELKILIEEK